MFVVRIATRPVGMCLFPTPCTFFLIHVQTPNCNRLNLEWAWRTVSWGQLFVDSFQDTTKGCANTRTWNGTIWIENSNFPFDFFWRPWGFIIQPEPSFGTQKCVPRSFCSNFGFVFVCRVWQKKRSNCEGVGDTAATKAQEVNFFRAAILCGATNVDSG